MNKSSELNTPQTILIADDDDDVREYWSRTFESGGFRIIRAIDGVDALDKMNSEVSIVLLDHWMPKLTGLECLYRIHENYPNTQIVMLSSAGVEQAVKAMNNGAFWFLQKPAKSDEVINAVRNAAAAAKISRDNPKNRNHHEGKEPLGEASPLIPSALMTQVEKVAAIDCSVLITGETGTGKSTLARFIHDRSRRKFGPFVALNCAALPKDLLEAELFGFERGAFTGAVKTRTGRLELAHTGTVFLDEIGDMSLELQPKLLTFLEDRRIDRIGGVNSKTVDTRVISATLQDPEKLAKEGRFREDLYFRLKVVSLHLPPLRERREDLPAITRDLTARLAARYSLPNAYVDDSALGAVMEYDWPGNIRELENCLERSLLLSDDARVTAEMLPIGKSQNNRKNSFDLLSLGGIPLAAVEWHAIQQTLALCGGNKREAARRLGISEKSIYNKIQRFNRP